MTGGYRYYYRVTTNHRSFKLFCCSTYAQLIDIDGYYRAVNKAILNVEGHIASSSFNGRLALCSALLGQPHIVAIILVEQRRSSNTKLDHSNYVNGTLQNVTCVMILCFQKTQITTEMTSFRYGRTGMSRHCKTVVLISILGSVRGVYKHDNIRLPVYLLQQKC